MPTPASNGSALVQEWRTLQDNHERYENGALVLKLSALVLWCAMLALGFHTALMAGMVMVVWLQEGIYRTSQARLGERLVAVEACIRQGAADDQICHLACQLHTDWLAQRPGTLGLLLEYGKHALRPTVAFPYGVLLMALAWLAM